MNDKNEELVVLVDENDNEIGTMPKRDVHTSDTPLHRGFSVFLFKESKLLVQQRSHKKVTWPLMWSNSVCGHPGPGESAEDAVRRRGKEELGLEITSLELAMPYKYRFERGGVVENEICPVFVGQIEMDPIPNPDEVEDYKWLTWSGFLEEIKTNPDDWSEWCREESKILEEKGLVKDLI